MSKFKDLTSEEVGNIIDWYNRGLYSQRELAEIFDTSRATIRRVVQTPRPTCEETGPEVGHSEEVGQPTFDDVGQPMYEDDDYNPEGVITWVALAICLALALFTGYTIYNVMNP